MAPSLNATMTPAEVAVWERQLTAPRVPRNEAARERMRTARATRPGAPRKRQAMTQSEQAAVVDALLEMRK